LSGNSHGFQPPDAENRMSGGVGGVTGAIPLPPPDPGLIVPGQAPPARTRISLGKAERFQPQGDCQSTPAPMSKRNRGLLEAFKL